MFDDDTPKKYVTPEEGRKHFPSDAAIFICCVNCGRLLFLDIAMAPFCNGRDTSGCESPAHSLN